MLLKTHHHRTKNTPSTSSETSQVDHNFLQERLREWDYEYARQAKRLAAVMARAKRRFYGRER